MNGQRFPYGGQAVLEGVMMRGLRQATVAVRSPTGAIVFKHERLNVEQRRIWEHYPFLRGVLALWDALNLGVRSLTFASNVALGEEEQPSPAASAGTVAVSLLFAIGLFFVLPLLIASVLTHFGASLLVRDIAEGAIRLLLFIGYLAAIGRVPEIQRVFGYHGAEHKTINAYEAGAPLTVREVQGFTLIHPRCGTSFVLVVVVISIPLFAMFAGLPLWAHVPVRIALVPVIAAVAFELLRLSAANYHRAWVRALVAPSLALQRLTTREPDDQMVAVAIAALLPVLAADGVEVQQQEAGLAQVAPATVSMQA